MRVDLNSSIMLFFYDINVHKRSFEMLLDRIMKVGHDLVVERVTIG